MRLATGVGTGFTTERLTVRPLCADDVDVLYAVYGDPEVVRFVDDGTPLGRDGCQRWVEVTARNVAARGYGMMALVLRSTGEIAGFCGLVHPGGQPEAELKYALGRRWWGQGLATEAAAGMLAWGAATFGLQEVIATTYPANLPSHRVLEKAGMYRREVRDNGDGTSTWVFAWVAPSR